MQIYKATKEGNTEIVKIWAPLTKDPNAPTIHGETLIFVAACNGHTELSNSWFL